LNGWKKFFWRTGVCLQNSQYSQLVTYFSDKVREEGSTRRDVDGDDREERDGREMEGMGDEGWEVWEVWKVWRGMGEGERGGIGG
jgi:hypothetical protein